MSPEEELCCRLYAASLACLRSRESASALLASTTALLERIERLRGGR